MKATCENDISKTGNEIFSNRASAVSGVDEVWPAVAGGDRAILCFSVFAGLTALALLLD